MDSFKGKYAVVVGASSGVGRAALLTFASHGMRVCGVARSRDRLDRIVREAPGEAIALAEDASRPEVAERLLRDAPDRRRGHGFRAVRGLRRFTDPRT